MELLARIIVVEVQDYWVRFSAVRTGLRTKIPVHLALELILRDPCITSVDISTSGGLVVRLTLILVALLADGLQPILGR